VLKVNATGCVAGALHSNYNVGCCFGKLGL